MVYDDGVMVYFKRNRSLKIISTWKLTSIYHKEPLQIRTLLKQKILFVYVSLNYLKYNDGNEKHTIMVKMRALNSYLHNLSFT